MNSITRRLRNNHLWRMRRSDEQKYRRFFSGHFISGWDRYDVVISLLVIVTAALLLSTVASVVAVFAEEQQSSQAQAYTVVMTFG